MDRTSKHVPQHRHGHPAPSQEPEAQPAQPAPQPDSVDETAEAAAWLEQLHDDGPDLEQTGITPERSRICSYCQGSLDDGESHVHGGQPNPDDQRLDREVWADAAEAYAAALETAFNTFQETDRLAWDIYIAAREAADRRFEQAKVDAGKAWQQAIGHLKVTQSRG